MLPNEPYLSVKELKRKAINACYGANMINNMYFSRNPLKRYFFRRNLTSVLKAVQLSKNRKVTMDFGPGFGIFILPLSKMFERVVTLDIDDGQLSSSRRMIDTNAITNAELILKAREDEFEGLESDYYDCIIADNVLEHDKGAKKIIDNLSRILRKDGILVISLPTENWIYRLFESKYDGHVFRTNGEIGELISYCQSLLEEVAIFDVFPFYYTRAYQKKREISI